MLILIICSILFQTAVGFDAREARIRTKQFAVDRAPVTELVTWLLKEIEKFSSQSDKFCGRFWLGEGSIATYWQTKDFPYGPVQRNADVLWPLVTNELKNEGFKIGEFSKYSRMVECPCAREAREAAERSGSSMYAACALGCTAGPYVDICWDE